MPDQFLVIKLLMVRIDTQTDFIGKILQVTLRIGLCRSRKTNALLHL